MPIIDNEFGLKLFYIWIKYCKNTIILVIFENHVISCCDVVLHSCLITHSFKK